jgi:hypothetical protein
LRTLAAKDADRATTGAATPLAHPPEELISSSQLVQGGAGFRYVIKT